MQLFCVIVVKYSECVSQHSNENYISRAFNVTFNALPS